MTLFKNGVVIGYIRTLVYLVTIVDLSTVQHDMMTNRRKFV